MPINSSLLAQWHHRWTVFERDLGAAFSLDPYHSYISLFYQIQKNKPVYIFQENESRMYRDLLFRSYKPGYGLFEMTLYPTTALSAWIKSSYKDFYDEFTVFKDINLIGSISSGYQEPWSASFFIGQLAPFLSMNEAEELVVAATGASGLVLTGGAYQIFNNCLVRSNWHRVEWKLKGESTQADLSYDWDIKAGYRFYNLDEIANTILFGISRKRVNRGKFDWRWSQNSVSEFELQLPVSNNESGISRFKYIYGRVIPFRKWMVGLGVGVIYENRREYDVEQKQFSAEKEESWNLYLTPFAYW
ncbi:MAG: hypothetical protein JXR87_07215 [Candidatus Marinimicrobia bacterium]|nr:hypothetical protein [Candidatus Neomarinimicrobiota bacterium]